MAESGGRYRNAQSLDFYLTSFCLCGLLSFNSGDREKTLFHFGLSYWNSTWHVKRNWHCRWIALIFISLWWGWPSRLHIKNISFFFLFPFLWKKEEDGTLFQRWEWLTESSSTLKQRPIFLFFPKKTTTKTTSSRSFKVVLRASLSVHESVR